VFAAAQKPDNANLVGGWRVSFGPATPPEEFITLLFNEGGTASFLVAAVGRSSFIQTCGLHAGPKKRAGVVSKN